jgi:hypothetical protein
VHKIQQQKLIIVSIFPSGSNWRGAEKLLDFEEEGITILRNFGTACPI